MSKKSIQKFNSLEPSGWGFVVDKGGAEKTVTMRGTTFAIGSVLHEILTSDKEHANDKKSKGEQRIEKALSSQ